MNDYDFNDLVHECYAEDNPPPVQRRPPPGPKPRLTSVKLCHVDSANAGKPGYHPVSNEAWKRIAEEAAAAPKKRAVSTAARVIFLAVFLSPAVAVACALIGMGMYGE